MSSDGANSFFSGDFYQTLSSNDSSLISTVDSFSGTPGGIGFIDEIGGSVSGFFSCTESLGFESFDERSTDDCSSIEELDAYAESEKSRKRSKERSAEKRRDLSFPPPLTSLNRYGWPSFVLRPVRKDGRLELTEVKIHRPEILRASRENGRLTIHLVKEEVGDDETEEAGSEDAGENFEVENEEIDEDEVSESEIGIAGEEIRLPVAVGGDGGGEGLRRCYHRYEGAGKSQICHMDVWSPRCVPTR